MADIGTWEGGIIRGGRYYIRRQIDGKRWEIPVGRDPGRALAELALFHRDEKGFVDEIIRKKTEVEKQRIEAEKEKAEARGIFLNDAMIERFASWAGSKENYQTKTRGNGPRWITTQKSTLVWWRKALNGKDLRHLAARDIDRLETPKGWRIRVVVLKTLYKWLRRKERVLEISQDPTQDVETPRTAVGRIDDEDGKVVPFEVFSAVREWLLTSPYPIGRPQRRKGGNVRNLGRVSRAWSREATGLLADVIWGTGAHVRETLRFAFKGKVIVFDQTTAKIDSAGKIVTPLAKRGRPHAFVVSKAVLDSAQRLRAIVEPLGYKILSPEEELCYRAIMEDVAAAKCVLGITRFGLGWGRHTVATYAAEHGATDQQIAQSHGNSAPQIAGIYARTATHPKLPTQR